MLERSRDDRILQPWICLASDSVREPKTTKVILHPTQATAGFYEVSLFDLDGMLRKALSERFTTPARLPSLIDTQVAVSHRADAAA